MKEMLMIKDSDTGKIIGMNANVINQKAAGIISWNFNDDKIKEFHSLIGDFILIDEENMKRIYDKMKSPIYNTNKPVCVFTNNTYYILQEAGEENVWSLIQ